MRLISYCPWPNCGLRLEAFDNGLRCPRRNHYVLIRQPEVSFGEIFAANDRPWGQLIERHGHYAPHGWREDVRAPVKLER